MNSTHFGNGESVVEIDSFDSRFGFTRFEMVSTYSNTCTRKFSMKNWAYMQLERAVKKSLNWKVLCCLELSNFAILHIYTRACEERANFKIFPIACMPKIGCQNFVSKNIISNKAVGKMYNGELMLRNRRSDDDAECICIYICTFAFSAT